MEFDIPAFSPVIREAMERGRGYRQVPLWVRILNGLRGALDEITCAVLADTIKNPRKAVLEHIQPLAKRCNLLLAR